MYNINLDEILTKIKEVPIGKVTCVAELIDYSPEKDEDYIDVFEQMEIVKKVDTLLKNNNINIEYINDEKGGLPLYSKFQKTNMIDKENNESEIPDNIKDKIYKILSHNTGMNENIKIRKVSDNLYFAFGLPDENGIDSVVVGLDMSYLCGDSSRGMNNLISEYNSGKRSEEFVLEKDESKEQVIEIDPIPYLEKLKTYSVEELKEEKHRLSNEAFSSIPQTDEEKQRKAMNIEYMKVIDKLLRTPRAQNEVVLSKIKDFIRFKDPREMYHYRQQDLEELNMYDDFKELPPKFKMWVDMAIREIYEDTKLAEMPFDTNNIPHIDLNAMVKAIDKAIYMEKNNTDVPEKIRNKIYKILSYDLEENETIEIHKINNDLYYGYVSTNRRGPGSMVIGNDLSYLWGGSFYGMNQLVSEYNSGKRSEDFPEENNINANDQINNLMTNIDNFLNGSDERIRTPEETKLQEDKAEIRIRIELREKLAKAMRVYSDVEFPHVEIIKNNNQVYIDYPDEIMELRDYMLNSSYYNKEYNFDIQTIMNKSIPTLTADETFAYMYYILKAENQQKGYIANMINSNVFNMLCCRLYNYTYDLI